MIERLLLGLACVIGGFIVSYPILKDHIKGLETLEDFFEKTRGFFGVYCVIIGLYALISPNEGLSKLGNLDIPILGDFIPAILSIAIGLILSDRILAYINFSEDEDKSKDRKKKLMDMIDKYQVIAGICGIVFGFIHFFLAGTLFI